MSKSRDSFSEKDQSPEEKDERAHLPADKSSIEQRVEALENKLRKKLKYLGGGSYNHVFSDGRLAYKFMKHPTLPTDLQERSVRIWNEINIGLTPKAKLVEWKMENGSIAKCWSCPLIDGRQANDNEIYEALIDIYNRTGRIILDAAIPGNFKVKDDKVICVDIGLALRLDAKEDKLIKDHRRRHSKVSVEAWQMIQEEDQSYLSVKYMNQYRLTTLTVKALLFIKSHYPDITNVDFFKKSTREQYYIRTLAAAYDGIGIQKAKEMLEYKKPENIQESCINLLESYIKKRGTFENQTFKPSLRTHLFRKTAITIGKVEEVEKLLYLTKNPHYDFQAMRESYGNLLERLLLNGAQQSELLGILNRCLMMIDISSSREKIFGVKAGHWPK